MLFLKITLNKTLKIKQSIKNKNNKVIIIINFISNITRFYKFELCFIKKITNFQYFS